MRESARIPSIVGKLRCYAAAVCVRVDENTRCRVSTSIKPCVAPACFCIPLIIATVADGGHKLWNRRLELNEELKLVISCINAKDCLYCASLLHIPAKAD